MTTYGFQYRVEVKVLFTPEDIAHLLRLAFQHYDGKCRATAEKGGFLYGLNNMRSLNTHPEIDPVAYVLDWDKVDILCKITEMEYIYKHKSILHMPLLKLFGEMRKESDRVNPTDTTTITEIDQALTNLTDRKED
jgi:hypothetical protein